MTPIAPNEAELWQTPALQYRGAVKPGLAQLSYLLAAASFAHCQNFSAAGLGRLFDAAMPRAIGSGSGLRGKSFTRFPKLCPNTSDAIATPVPASSDETIPAILSCSSTI